MRRGKISNCHCCSPMLGGHRWWRAAGLLRGDSCCRFPTRKLSHLGWGGDTEVSLWIYTQVFCGEDERLEEIGHRFDPRSRCRSLRLWIAGSSWFRLHELGILNPHNVPPLERPADVPFECHFGSRHRTAWRVSKWVGGWVSARELHEVGRGQCAIVLEGWMGTVDTTPFKRALTSAHCRSLGFEGATEGH